MALCLSGRTYHNKLNNKLYFSNKEKLVNVNSDIIIIIHAQQHNDYLSILFYISTI